MNSKPQVTLAITERPNGVQLLDRHLGLQAIWGSIYRLGTAISQQVRDIVLDLNERVSSIGRRSHARTAN